MTLLGLGVAPPMKRTDIGRFTLPFFFLENPHNFTAYRPVIFMTAAVIPQIVRTSMNLRYLFIVFFLFEIKKNIFRSHSVEEREKENERVLNSGLKRQRKQSPKIKKKKKRNLIDDDDENQKRYLRFLSDLPAILALSKPRVSFRDPAVFTPRFRFRFQAPLSQSL